MSGTAVQSLWTSKRSAVVAAQSNLQYHKLVEVPTHFSQAGDDKCVSVITRVRMLPSDH